MADPSTWRGAHAPGGLAEARAAFIEWIDAAGAGGRTFLQVRVRREPTGRYEVCHSDDDGLDAAALSLQTDPYAARHLAQTTAAGQHRPLKTAPNLRRGWRLAELDAAALCIAMDYLYPACVAHWHAGTTGTLRVTHWRQTAARQTGIYGAVGLLSETAVRQTVRACCDASVCLRRVVWQIDETVPLAVPEAEPAGTAAVPCPEACSLFISFARTVLQLERRPREAVAFLGMLSAEECEQLREIVDAAAEGTLDAVREGDFEHGANCRRIRYLSARLQAESPAADVPGE